jgi:hypothetical protein
MRREQTQINKIGNEKGVPQQTPMKSRGSLENTLKICIQINWKI